MWSHWKADYNHWLHKLSNNGDNFYCNSVCQKLQVWRNISNMALPFKWWVAPNFSISCARVEFNSMHSISENPLSLKSEMPKIPRRPPPCEKKHNPGSTL